MKKLLLVMFSISTVSVLYAQDSTNQKKKTDWSKIDLSNRPDDHVLIQFGYDGWMNTPDSINPSGFNRHFNFYLMYNKPFKANPHYSLGIGVGMGSSNMYFKNTYIDLKSKTGSLPFVNVTNSSIDHYEKFKITTIFVEAPVEFRYSSNAVTPDKGMKAALGFKLGMLVKGYTKGKNAIDANGATIYGSKYIIKEQEKQYLQNTRFAATARIGYGFFSIDYSYQFTNFLKSTAGPSFHPWSIGLTISGL